MPISTLSLGRCIAIGAVSATSLIAGCARRTPITSAAAVETRALVIDRVVLSTDGEHASLDLTLRNQRDAALSLSAFSISTMAQTAHVVVDGLPVPLFAPSDVNSGPGPMSIDAYELAPGGTSRWFSNPAYIDKPRASPRAAAYIATHDQVTVVLRSDVRTYSGGGCGSERLETTVTVPVVRRGSGS